MPKTTLSEIDPIKDTYGLSNLQIQEWEIVVGTRQYYLQLSYHKKFENYDNFTQAKWRPWSRDMNEIMNFVRRHGYYYLVRQKYNIYFKKLKVIQRIMAEEYIYIADRPISLDDLKIKLYQVEAKNPSFYSN